MKYNYEQGNGRHSRLGQRKIDAPQRPPVAGSVDIGRLFNFLRQFPEEIHQQNHIEHRYGRRQDQRPDRVQQVHAFDRHVGRNQSAVKQHCNNEEPGVDIA
ncbi:hypothetical protein D3C75_704540 [compost metagenome]